MMLYIFIYLSKYRSTSFPAVLPFFYPPYQRRSLQPTGTFSDLELSDLARVGLGARSDLRSDLARSWPWCVED